MRRTLGTLVLVLLLGGLATACGSGKSTDDTATDPTPSQTSTDKPTADGPVDFTEVALLSQTASSGEASEVAVLLDDAAAVTQFSEQFGGGSLASQVSRRFEDTEIPEGQALIAAVVSVGCDVPPGVIVTATDQGLAIRPQKVVNPHQECFVAVTTVALVLVDAGLL